MDTPEVKESRITYRFLDREEFGLLEPHFATEGLLPPHPITSLIAAAFDGDKVVGYIVFQLVPHVEPIWISEEYRGAGVWRELATLIDTWCKIGGISGFYVQPTSPKVEKMAADFGCSPCEHNLWIKQYYDARDVYADIARQLASNERID